MRTSISMLALAALTASYDYCQSLGHYGDDVWIVLLVTLWGVSFALSLVRDFQELNDPK